jgi:hypothetical protein
MQAAADEILFEIDLIECLREVSESKGLILDTAEDFW